MTEILTVNAVREAHKPDICTLDSFQSVRKSHPSFNLTISLAEPVLLLRGYKPEEWNRPAAVLRGTVHLKLKRATRFSSLSLNLTCMSTVSWPHVVRQGEQWVENEEMYNHRLEVLPERKEPYLFEAGQLEYPFEIPIPHNAPESTSTELGSISYTLECLAKRVGKFNPNVTAKLMVPVARVASEETFEKALLSTRSTVFDNKVLWAKLKSNENCRLGDILGCTVKLVPNFLGLKAQTKLYLVESTQYYSEVLNKSRRDPDLWVLVKETEPQVVEEKVEIPLPVRVPNLPRKINRLNPSSFNSNISITHKLVCLVHVKCSDNSTFTAIMESPVRLLGKHATHLEVFPPSYASPCYSDCDTTDSCGSSIKTVSSVLSKLIRNDF
uniref:ARAD1A08734p n=1 Tax=Blastobotrys adeninivorans TaxID=409370 RepID=A0A060SXE5_BLAAD